MLQSIYVEKFKIRIHNARNPWKIEIRSFIYFEGLPSPPEEKNIPNKW